MQKVKVLTLDGVLTDEVRNEVLDYLWVNYKTDSADWEVVKLDGLKPLDQKPLAESLKRERVDGVHVVVTDGVAARFPVLAFYIWGDFWLDYDSSLWYPDDYGDVLLFVNDPDRGVVLLTG